MCKRALCSLFRNKTRRRQICRYAQREFVNAKERLKHFTAPLNKWRYETLFDCFSQLLPLKDLCEYLVDHIKIILVSFQDGELLEEVLVALRWTEFLIFLQVFFDRVVSPLELGRRWALLCKYRKAERDERRLLQLPRKKQRCPFASKRLSQARQFYFDLFDAMADRGKAISVAGCSGLHWIAIDVAAAERMTSATWKRKGSWLNTVPWRFTEALDPVQTGSGPVDLTTTGTHCSSTWTLLSS